MAEARPRLLGLFDAVSLVLLIACVNLVSLLFVHIESRRSEFAVRVALGAGRGRLIRQLLIESTLLALAGGLVGLFVSNAATGWLLDRVPRGLPLAHRATLDATVAVFGTGIALLAGLAIGQAAAYRVDPRRLGSSLESGSRTVAGARATRRLHGWLVAAEVALSLVLLVAATLLLRSMVALHRTNTGFDPHGVLTFEAALTRMPDASSGPGFLQELESRLSAMPGVAAVGGTSALPFSRWGQSARVEIIGASPGTSETGRAERRVATRFVSPRYFDAIRLPVRAGRAFGDADRDGAAPVAIVNEGVRRGMARRSPRSHWPRPDRDVRAERDTHRRRCRRQREAQRAVRGRPAHRLHADPPGEPPVHALRREARIRRSIDPRRADPQDRGGDRPDPAVAERHLVRGADRAVDRSRELLHAGRDRIRSHGRAPHADRHLRRRLFRDPAA